MANGHLFPSTSDRVSQNTADHVNQNILRGMEKRIAHYMRQPADIPKRLRELEYEWDIERVLEVWSATLGLVGVALARRFDRRWIALPAVVSSFMFLHGTKGWCPPVPVLRRLGVRTAREIESERTALKALRGDFEGATREDVSAQGLLRKADPSFYRTHFHANVVAPV